MLYWRANKSKLLAIAHAHRRAPRRRTLSTTIAPEQSDVVIVGGGPAGLALAAALGCSRTIQDTLRITLVEGGDLSKIAEWSPQPGTFSNRVSSITNSSQDFLNDICAWSHVDVERTGPIEEMQVWDGVSDARITFSATELSSYRPGASVEMARLTENLNLQRGLLRRISAIPAVKLIDKVKVQSIQKADKQGGDWPLVHLSDGRILRARLLVGADGFSSPVRSYAGIQSYGWAYDTQAIVATLSHNPRVSFQPPNTIAYQRFLPTGPIAFLPLSDSTSSLVWSTKPLLAKALMESDPAVLVSMINAAFRLPEISVRYLHDRILEAHATGATLTLQQIVSEIDWRERSHGIDRNSAYSLSLQRGAPASGVPPADAVTIPPFVTSVQPGTVASFPLRYSHADSYIGEGPGARTVLVGDAAHTVHPLAGQGLNMGLADVECLAKCIDNAVLGGGDIGSHTALMPYARERYFENHKIMATVDKLHKLYSSTAEPIVWARSVGIEILNELDTLKAAIMMSAGSRSSDVRTAGSSVSWSVGASGIENLARSVASARSFSGNVAGLVGANVQRLFKQVLGSR